jgi:hypothetical protein
MKGTSEQMQQLLKGFKQPGKQRYDFRGKPNDGTTNTSEGARKTSNHR